MGRQRTRTITPLHVIDWLIDRARLALGLHECGDRGQIARQMFFGGVPMKCCVRSYQESMRRIRQIEAKYLRNWLDEALGNVKEEEP